jgi:hypothetical protein
VFDVCDWSSTLTPNSCRCTTKLTSTADPISFLVLKILEEHPEGVSKGKILKENPERKSLSHRDSRRDILREVL